MYVLEMTCFKEDNGYRARYQLAFVSPEQVYDAPFASNTGISTYFNSHCNEGTWAPLAHCRSTCHQKIYQAARSSMLSLERIPRTNDILPSNVSSLTRMSVSAIMPTCRRLAPGCSAASPTRLAPAAEAPSRRARSAAAALLFPPPSPEASGAEDGGGLACRSSSSSSSSGGGAPCLTLSLASGAVHQCLFHQLLVPNIAMQALPGPV